MLESMNLKPALIKKYFSWLPSYISRRWQYRWTSILTSRPRVVDFAEGLATAL